KITFVSTIHKEIGKCNADALCNIIEKEKPQVIFLEALQETYTKYEKDLFSSFEIFHKKLEIKAIQKYGLNNSCAYIPVLDNGLSDAFIRKYEIVCENREMQKLIDNFNSLAAMHGFNFLNSTESINLQKNMRLLESQIIVDCEFEKTVLLDIDQYENAMIRNIYSYSKENNFNSAIFMCGVAHRKSIIEKIKKFNKQKELNLNWMVFGN
ncbi:MAG: hypothetical protein KBT69_01775, partial [Oceanihabitans sp.]|nr:hypothetical protein [Oceanihabitans sp.]